MNTPRKMTEEELQQFATQYRLADIKISCQSAIDELNRAIGLEDLIQQSLAHKINQNAILSIKVDEITKENQKLRELLERAIEEMEGGDPVGTADQYRKEYNQLTK